MEKQTDYLEIDLLQMVRALWNRAWMIVAAAILCAACAFAYARFYIQPMYQSSALMYVNNSSISIGSSFINTSELAAAQSLVDTYIVILNTRTTLEEVIEEADLPYTYEQLSGMVRAGAVNDTEIFRITVTAPDPGEAEKIANTITYVLPEKIAGVVDGSSVRTVDFAVVPSHKSSPNITKITAIGMVIGALVCSALIVIIEMTDEMIHSGEYLMSTYDIPILAEIPELTGEKTHAYRRYGNGYRYSKYAKYAKYGREGYATYGTTESTTEG